MNINVDYLFLLKKITCFEVELAILFIKLEDFNKYIKCNPLP